MGDLDAVLAALKGIGDRLTALESAGVKTDAAVVGAAEPVAEPAALPAVAAPATVADAVADPDKDKDLADMRAKIDALEAKVPKALSGEDEAAMADAQAKADSAYSAFGKRAPAPLVGEGRAAYRTRLVGGMQKHSAEFKDVNLAVAVADSNLFAIIEGKVYADAQAAAAVAPTIEKGQARMNKRMQGATEITEYAGSSSAVFREFQREPNKAFLSRQ